jgi:hypothetical protein
MWLRHETLKLFTRLQYYGTLAISASKRENTAIVNITEHRLAMMMMMMMMMMMICNIFYLQAMISDLNKNQCHKHLLPSAICYPTCKSAAFVKL